MILGAFLDIFLLMLNDIISTFCVLCNLFNKLCTYNVAGVVHSNLVPDLNACSPLRAAIYLRFTLL